MASKVVLDASALLALCFAEEGAKIVAKRGEQGVMSAVNYSEAIAKSSDFDIPVETINQALDSLNLTIIPFDHEHAMVAASFRPSTRNLNVSFADRACLAAAAVARIPVLTADRKWQKFKTGVKIILIR